MTLVTLVHKLEEFIIQDAKLSFTLTSYLLVFLTYVNLTATHWFLLGVLTFISYFLINGTFLSHAFFGREEPFFRFVLGVLSLIMLLGFSGWLIMLIYNLDAPLFTLTLLVTTTVSSILNGRMKHKNAIH